ncbi:MAG: ABC transporter ATP-binding protein [Clostridia bacterium]|nr:ABC transporter ATP-binding protein [Clostridia bacterium]
MKKEKQKKDKIDWKRTFRNNFYILGMIRKSAPGILWTSTFSAVFSSVTNFLTYTYLLMYALNALQRREKLSDIITTLVFILTFNIANLLITYFLSVYRELNIPKVDAYIQNTIHKKAAEVELSCFENAEFYDVYVKANGEAINRAYNVLNCFLDILWSVINVCSVVVLMITINPLFLPLTFIPLIGTLTIGKRRNRVSYEYSVKRQETERQKDYVRRTFYLSDFSKEMRMTEMYKVMFTRMRESVAELKAIAKKYGYKMMWFRYLFEDIIFDVAVNSVSMIASAYMTLVTGSMLIGDCVMIINNITSMSYTIDYMGASILRLDEHSLYIDNLRSFLEYETKIPEIESAPPVPPFESLSLKDLGFKYDGKDKPVLKKVDLSIKKGERIALVGHNGAGKSTLVKLLLRFYDPTEGEILINGKSIKDYRLSSYRELFGTVFQDYALFATTVEENVMLKDGLTEEEKNKVTDALKKSGIYEKIESFPHSAQTVVTKEFDDDGVVFSGGEAQKISIARIFALDREIVIMDEPTSALDPIAEQEMYKNMFAACEGKTVIFISHRLSSATMADRVYLFENGCVAESGTHGELLELNGKYAEMWHKQADAYIEGSEVRA